MATQRERTEWINKIDALTVALSEGHLFGGAFSEDNRKVLQAANNAKALLIDYADIVELPPDKRNALSEVMGALSNEVDAYFDAKRTQKNPYSLEGDTANGIAKATGSKKTRLEAAQSLKELAAEANTALYRDIADPSATTTTTVNRLDLDGLKERNQQKDEAKSTRIRLRNAAKSYTEEREQHKQESVNGWKPKTLADDFGNISDLHRDDLMSYTTDKDFLEKYQENRLKIDKTVSAYREITKLQRQAPNNDEARKKVQSFKFLTGLTDKKIASAKEKVDTLEMIGRHMDAKMKLVTNSEFTKLSDKQKTALDKLSVTDIDKKLREANRISDEAKKKATRNMYNALKQIKELEAIGVTQVASNQVQGSASVHDKTKKIGRGSFRFQFLGAAYKGPNLNSGVSGSYSSKDGLTLVDKSLPVEGKVKLLKFSSKFQSKNKLVNAGFRVNGLTAKASANVGASFSLSNPLNIKAYANAGAEAHGLRLVGKGKIGNNKASIFGRADGSIGHAAASGSVGVGAITIEDPDTKEKKTALGIEAGGSLKAEVFTGKISGGFSIMGVKFSGSLKGSAISAGLEGKAQLTTGGISLGLGAALGLGGGFEVSIDWTGLKDKFMDWKKRKAVSKLAAEKLRAERRARRAAKNKIRIKDDSKKRERKTEKNKTNGPAPATI